MLGPKCLANLARASIRLYRTRMNVSTAVSRDAQCRPGGIVAALAARNGLSNIRPWNLYSVRSVVSRSSSSCTTSCAPSCTSVLTRLSCPSSPLLISSFSCLRICSLVVFYACFRHPNGSYGLIRVCTISCVEHLSDRQAGSTSSGWRSLDRHLLYENFCSMSKAGYAWRVVLSTLSGRWVVSSP